MKILKLLASATALLCAAMGCEGDTGNGDGDGDGDGDDGNPTEDVSLDDFLAGSVSADETNWTSLGAQAYCRRVSECACSPKTDCESTIERVFGALVPSADLAFEFVATAADQCVRALASGPCEQSEWRNSCFQIYRGTLPPGSECTAYGECAGGVCDGLEDGSPGTCIEMDLGEFTPEPYCLD